MHIYIVSHTTDRPSRRVSTFIKRLHRSHTLRYNIYVYTRSSVHRNTHLRRILLYIIFSLAHFLFLRSFFTWYDKWLPIKNSCLALSGPKNNIAAHHSPPYFAESFCTHVVINCLSFPIGLCCSCECMCERVLYYIYTHVKYTYGCCASLGHI